jgi:AMP nucleosidase
MLSAIEETLRAAGKFVLVATGHDREDQEREGIRFLVGRNYDRDYWTGTVYTTNRRVWEHDDKFKAYLRAVRAMAIDMETATLFITGFYNKIPTGALLLVSDQPMIHSGVKTSKSDRKVTQKYLDMHLQIGIDSLKELINKGETVKHLRF